MKDIYKYMLKGRNYYCTRFIRIASIGIALRLKNSKLIPEQIVMVGLLIGIMSVYLYSWGSYPAVLFASLLYILAWFLDFIDGDLARLTNRVSERGEWLDSISGRILETLIYFGVCLGLARIYNSTKVWILGFIIVALHHIIISLMQKEAVLELKSQKENITQSEETLDKRKKIGILKIILRELTVGPNLNGYMIILGGLINNLMLAMKLCLLYNVSYLLLRLTNKTRQYFLPTHIS